MSYELIIIGGGPAGITAGIYATRKRIKTLLLTKDFLGQVGKTGEIDNWPGAPGISGMDLAKSFSEHLKKFSSADIKQGVEIKEGTEVAKVEKTSQGFVVRTKDNQEFSVKAVIAANGRHPRHLNIPGEQEFTGRGVSFCSICDAPFFKNKAVVVVGGGNAGFEAALDVAKYAKRVFIFEGAGKFKADEIFQTQTKRISNIQLHLNKQVQKIEGNNKVQSITYKDTVAEKFFQVPCDGVFVAVGSLPITGYLKGACELNEKGEVKVNPVTCETSAEGLFAAGDINDKPFKQIVTAVADGCRAALAAYEYLQNKNTP